MISKINFKQPKYIFPLVVFIPLKDRGRFERNEHL